MLVFTGKDFEGQSPRLAEGVYCDPSSNIIGDVVIGEGSKIGAKCHIRGDGNSVRIGCGVAIADGAVIHTANLLPVVIGDHVSIGPRAVVHVSTVEEGCSIGSRAVVLNGAVVGKGSIVAAGSVVAAGMKTPPYSLLEGVPARITGTIAEERRK